MLGLMEYWRLREADWPHLAAMAYDFHSILVMSSECKRVFSSCGKMTTPESSRLLGKTLWYHECLKNWQRRGAIQIETYKNALILIFKDWIYLVYLYPHWSAADQLDQFSKSAKDYYVSQSVQIYPQLITDWLTYRTLWMCSYPSSPYSIWYHISEPRILCP